MSYISNKAKGLSGAKHIAHSTATGSDGERRFYDSCKSKKLDIKKTPAKDDMHHSPVSCVRCAHSCVTRIVSVLHVIWCVHRVVQGCMETPIRFGTSRQ